MITLNDITVDAQVEPIDLNEVKSWLNVGYNDKDFLINKLISESRDTIEHICGRSIVGHSYRMTIDTTETNEHVALLMPDIDIVDKVTKVDVYGAETELDATDYVVTGDNEKEVVLTEIGRYKIDYTTIGKLPLGLETCVKDLIAAMFESRPQPDIDKIVKRALMYKVLRAC